MDCDTLVGKSQAQVRRLLGKPHWRVRNNTPGSTVGWIYGLGGVYDGFDSQDLSVNFDEKGHVIDLTLGEG